MVRFCDSVFWPLESLSAFYFLDGCDWTGVGSGEPFLGVVDSYGHGCAAGAVSLVEYCSVHSCVVYDSFGAMSEASVDGASGGCEWYGSVVYGEAMCFEADLYSFEGEGA